jgi:hypothetical protein
MTAFAQLVGALGVPRTEALSWRIKIDADGDYRSFEDVPRNSAQRSVSVRECKTDQFDPRIDIELAEYLTKMEINGVA